MGADGSWITERPYTVDVVTEVYQPQQLTWTKTEEYKSNN